MFPVQSWARLATDPTATTYEVAAKHHQWITLSYEAVLKLTKNYDLNAITYQHLLNHYGLNGKVCLDEYYFFEALFGDVTKIPATGFTQKSLMEAFARKNEQEKLVDAKPVDRCYTLACLCGPVIDDMLNSGNAELFVERIGGCLYLWRRGLGFGNELGT